MAVGAHVLHRGGADGPGDTGERLDAGQARRQRPGDESVPDRARAGAHDDRAGGVLVDDGGDPAERLHVDDGALEGGVGCQQVRPAADNEERASGGIGCGDSIHQGVGRRNAHVVGNGAAHAQGRQISKGRHAPKPSRRRRGPFASSRAGRGPARRGESRGEQAGRRGPARGGSRYGRR